LDWSLTYHRHLESLHKKLTSRIALLRWLAGSSWSAGATTLQIATTALVHSTKEYYLPIRAGIQPAELHHNGATLSPERRAMEPEHLLHSALTRPPSADVQHLKSRNPFVPATQQLISFSDNNI